MEGNDSLHIEELLIKYCGGTATPEEACKVEAWMKESKENYTIAKQIYLLFLATDMQRIGKVDTEQALLQVKKRINRIRIFRTCWQWTQKVAVVLLIPLVITIFVLYKGDSSLPGETVQMMEVRTNPGMITSFRLPDSTLVFLNSESTLRYPSAFTGDVREVCLSGEAYFEVAKNLKRHFVVSTPQNSKVEVLGTKFNLEAFEDMDRVITTLVEGRVQFVYEESDGTHLVSMDPGQKVVHRRGDSETQLYYTDGISELSWKDEKIIFNNTPFKEALHMLEKRYHVEFIVKDPVFKDYAFTGTFTKQRLERILEYFKISSDIHWRYLDDSNLEYEKTRIELY